VFSTIGRDGRGPWEPSGLYTSESTISTFEDPPSAPPPAMDTAPAPARHDPATARRRTGGFKGSPETGIKGVPADKGRTSDSIPGGFDAWADADWATIRHRQKTLSPTQMLRAGPNGSRTTAGKTLLEPPGKAQLTLRKLKGPTLEAALPSGDGRLHDIWRRNYFKQLKNKPYKRWSSENKRGTTTVMMEKKNRIAVSSRG